MVGLSRQMIADPYWGNKAYTRRPNAIRKCISCLVGCWQESLMIRRHMRCTINPAVGDERFVHIAPADRQVRVAVVGGGPAGMEAARIAHLRGHQVTIFEKTGELGGAILYCCPVPGKHKMRWYADWQRHQVAELGIEVQPRTRPSIEMLEPFDAVVLATGAQVVRPAIPGIDQPFVKTFEEMLLCRMQNCAFHPQDKPLPPDAGQKVIVWGDYFATSDMAEKLASEGKQVIVVTEQQEFAEWMEPCHKDVMMKRFAGGNGEGLQDPPFAHPVKVICGTTIVEITDQGVVTLMDKDFRKSELKVDNVVLTSVAPADTLYAELMEAGRVVVKIGDARQVRNLRAAVTEGANIGLTLDEGLILNANRSAISRLPTDVQLS
jgi:NADPH-dependent 2,4-dienoyl-CoA reductase/sulfur reductase-like enzyme